MDLEAARRGDENVSTPRELARLAEIVARGEGLSPARATDILAVASVPDEGSHFRRGLPAGVRAVSKPGALEGVRCEAAWVDVPGRPYAAADHDHLPAARGGRRGRDRRALGRDLRHLRPPGPLQPVRPHRQRPGHRQSSCAPATAGGSGRSSVRSPLAPCRRRPACECSLIAAGSGPEAIPRLSRSLRRSLVASGAGPAVACGRGDRLRSRSGPRAAGLRPMSCGFWPMSCAMWPMSGRVFSWAAASEAGRRRPGLRPEWVKR